MKILKEIDLSPATALMEKVDAMQRELDMEKKSVNGTACEH